jgi:putative DNA primase/helicase
MFAQWIEARGTRGDAEELAALRHVVAVLGERGAANFLWWHRAAEDRVPNPPMRWGLRRLLDGETPIESNSQWGARFGTESDSAGNEETSAEYFVFVGAFREHLCAGFDPQFVAKVLNKRGHLKPENATRLDRKERLPGIGSARVYRVLPSIFEDTAL